MRWKSIMQENPCECYFCGSTRDLERHHAIHGIANRKLAEEDGLYVNICGSFGGCQAHYQIHNGNRPLDRALQRQAQRMYLETHTLGEWMERYGKNYL